MCFKKVKTPEIKTIDKIKTSQISTADDLTLVTLGKFLINESPLIVDFSRLEREGANKALAFLSGVAYALSGEVLNLREEIFLFTTKNSYLDGTLSIYLKKVE
ncbi:MAG: cell division protein SepF [Acholeplasmatales bacterium]|jgi:cell division inhibitor SepF|nr:cell division protein SepF [Acholeplasmatales bacterium]